MCKSSLWVVNCAPRGCAKKRIQWRCNYFPGYCKSSVMICKKTGQPGIQPCKKEKRRKNTSLKPRQGLVQRGCLCRSTELVTLLRQQGRSPAEVGEGMRTGEVEAGGVVVWAEQSGRKALRNLFLSPSPHWEIDQRAQQVEHQHNRWSSRWEFVMLAACVCVCVRVQCINRQDGLHIDCRGAHYDHLWFTAARSFYRTHR